jgi:hypothetical protein
LTLVNSRRGNLRSVVPVGAVGSGLSLLKAQEMSRTINPVSIIGDAKKDGGHYDVAQYQSTHTCDVGW